MLSSFLDYFRSVMIRKIEGVDEEQLRWSPVQSGTCLGGLVKHLGYVERQWFQEVWGGREVVFPWSEDDPDAEFRVEPGDTAESLVEFYRQECAVSREIIASSALDESVETERGALSLRWILVHMIEETARHCGHADLIREMIDGSVGD